MKSIAADEYVIWIHYLDNKIYICFTEFAHITVNIELMLFSCDYHGQMQRANVAFCACSLVAIQVYRHNYC